MFYRDNIVKFIADYRRHNNVQKYIIYPFGKNGELVGTVLQDVFNIVPVAMVDNILSTYSDSIWSMDRLIKEYDADMCVIISTEDEVVNSSLERLLKIYIPTVRILNILSEEKKHWYGQNMQPKKFLFIEDQRKEEQITRNSCQENRKKYEIRFLLYQENILNTLDPVAEECNKRKDIHAMCIIEEKSNTKTGFKEWCEKRNVECVYGRQYDVEADKPDVMIVFNSYNRPSFSIKNYRKTIPLIVVVSSFLMPIERTICEHESLVLYNFGDIFPDYFLYDKYMYHKSFQSRLFGDRCVEMGNPKYDGIYRAQNGSRPKEWCKLNGKKTVLWAPAHTYRIGFNGQAEADPRTTFDKYAKVIFGYFKNNKDINLIFRPHPLFFSEMKLAAGWDDEDIDSFRVFFDESSNMVLDELDDYSTSYNIMDAVMTDVQCHICCSALPLQKPIAILYRPDEIVESNASEIADILYNLHSESEILDFLQMISEGKDPEKEERIKRISEFVKCFDGKNSERVVDFLISKVEDQRKC